MSDTFANPFSSIFWAGSPTDPRANPALRQKIALAMMMQQRKYPKTLGEGLSAIGEALGNMGLQRQIEASDRADQENIQKQLAPTPPAATQPPSATPRMSYTEENVKPPETPDAASMPTYGPNDPSPLVGEYNAEPSAAKSAETPQRFASVRYNNPGAQYPSAAAANYGSTGAGVIGGGHKIADFPTPVHGAAANMDLLSRGYTGMTVGDAISKWSGGGRNSVPGFNSRDVITREMLQNPDQAIPLMQAIAKGEAPGNYPMTPEQWQTAHQWFRQGGAPSAQPQQTAQAMPFDNTPTNVPAVDAVNAFAAGRQPQPQIQQAPQPQIAQAPQPGYVTPKPGPVSEVPLTSPWDAEIDRLNRIKAANPGSNYQSLIDAQLAPLVAARDFHKQQLLKAQERQLDINKELTIERERQQATAAERANVARKSAAEATSQEESAKLVQRTGMTPDQFYPRLDKEKAAIDNTLKAQSAQILARKAIAAGVITGYGANMKIASAKFADWAFNNGLKGDLAANTETMRASLDAGLSEAIRTINGTGANVSNKDVEIARGLQGSDPNLQMKTIQNIMDRAAAINYAHINNYEDYVKKYLGGMAAERFYQPGIKIGIPEEHVKIFEESQKGDPKRAAEVRAYFDRTYGPGAAELGVARLKRAGRLPDG